MDPHGRRVRQASIGAAFEPLVAGAGMREDRSGDAARKPARIV